MTGDGRSLLRLFTIPANRAFADALATGLIEKFDGDPFGLAQGMILLPSNRARTAMHAAFVRASGDGRLLPRMVALGDADLEESAGLALDANMDDAPLPPAVEPLRRRLILSRLIIENCRRFAIPLAAPASLALAEALGRVADQFHFEGLSPKLLDTVGGEDFSGHWQVSMRHLQLLLDQWPAELARIGAVDLADRRNQMLTRLAAAWSAKPPPGYVVAAGISVTAPSVAKLLRVIAQMPKGMTVFQGLDTAMPDAEWDALGPARPQGEGPLPLVSHPQYQFKLLLDRMDAARGEVQPWPDAGDRSADADRSGLVSAIFIPARFTKDWTARVPAGAAEGIRIAQFADDGAEALGIALMLRHALETPGRTAALVTPDRALAARVSSALARWDIVADDSAGQPLAQTPPGSLARLALQAATEGGLVPLMAFLSHPLVRPDNDRAGWIAQARLLDKWLRGPGKPSDLSAIAAWLRAQQIQLASKGRQDDQLDALISWWDGVAELLVPLWSFGADRGEHDPQAFFAALSALLDSLSAASVWAGAAGRQLAALFDRWQLAAPDGPATLPALALARQFGDLLASETVRAPFGAHPRLFIWGLLEARLQRADLMILGGLNEGGWPADISPDPWLAPGIRRQLGLPANERAQGLAAHDFATALGAPDVVVTRALQQGADPAVASRLWLRLTALASPLPAAQIDGVAVADLVAAMNRSDGAARPAQRPSVAVPPAARPRSVRVTALDTLARDPFAFYAAHILNLRPLDRLGESPDARWRGTRVHDLIEKWAKAGADPAELEVAIAKLAADPALSPIESAGWLPRIAPALRWVASEMVANQSAEREPVAHEAEGEWTIGGITLRGKADRIDRTAEGLVVVDYKSGSPPSSGDIMARRAMQLGLLASMIEARAFALVPDIAPSDAEYWVLKPDKQKSCDGHVIIPHSSRREVKSFADLVKLACAGLDELSRDFLLGASPFTPGERPGDYDLLARRDEWIGRTIGAIQP